MPLGRTPTGRIVDWKPPGKDTAAKPPVTDTAAHLGSKDSRKPEHTTAPGQLFKAN